MNCAWCGSEVHPEPGNRCGLRIGKHVVNGTVVAVTHALNRKTKFHVTVNQRIWKTKYGDYHVTRDRLTGWAGRGQGHG